MRLNEDESNEIICELKDKLNNDLAVSWEKYTLLRLLPKERFFLFI